MDGDIELYAYTAHYDDRTSLEHAPVVRVIIVMELSGDKDHMLCHLWFEQAPAQQVASALTAIGEGAYRHRKSFTEFIVTCPISGTNMPTHVSLVLRARDAPTFAVPVEHAASRAGSSNALGVCVSLSYWHHKPLHLIEWIEVQRMLGADTVVIYNNSLSLEAAKVFEHYASNVSDVTGAHFLTLRQSHNFMMDRGELTFHLQMSPVINDCMYRYRKRFRSILVIDLDEFVVPLSHDSLKDVLQAMEGRINSKHMPFFTYSFRNAYFFTDFEAEANQQSDLRTLKFLKRSEFSIPGYSTKSVIGNDVCVAMHNHFCWKYTARYEAREISPYLEVRYFS